MADVEGSEDRGWSFFRDGPPFLPTALVFIALLAIAQGANSPALGLAIVGIGVAITIFLEHRAWSKATPARSYEVDASFPTMRERLDNPPKRRVRKLQRIPGSMLYPDPVGMTSLWSMHDAGPMFPGGALGIAVVLGFFGGLIGPAFGFAMFASVLLVAYIAAHVAWNRRYPSREAEAMVDFPTLRKRLDAANERYKKIARPL